MALVVWLAWVGLAVAALVVGGSKHLAFHVVWVLYAVAYPALGILGMRQQRARVRRARELNSAAQR